MRIIIARASGGIGNTLARNFDKEDKELILTYNKSLEYYRPKLAKYEILKCNFTNKDEVKELYDNFSKIDVLINTMGGISNALVKKMHMRHG